MSPVHQSLCFCLFPNHERLRKYVVAPWDLLKMRGGVCGAIRVPGLSPNMPGTCSYR
jgi:hypothetical protein